MLKTRSGWLLCIGPLPHRTKYERTLKHHFAVFSFLMLCCCDAGLCCASAEEGSRSEHTGQVLSDATTCRCSQQSHEVCGRSASLHELYECSRSVWENGFTSRRPQWTCRGMARASSRTIHWGFIWNSMATSTLIRIHLKIVFSFQNALRPHLHFPKVARPHWNSP